eukprot:165999-Prymnesium_polylepis.1
MSLRGATPKFTQPAPQQESSNDVSNDSAAALPPRPPAMPSSAALFGRALRPRSSADHMVLDPPERKATPSSHAHSASLTACRAL